MWCIFFEGEVVYLFVEMDGVFFGDDVVKGGLGSLGLNIMVSKVCVLIFEMVIGRRVSGVMLVCC